MEASLRSLGSDEGFGTIKMRHPSRLVFIPGSGKKTDKPLIDAYEKSGQRLTRMNERITQALNDLPENLDHLSSNVSHEMKELKEKLKKLVSYFKPTMACNKRAGDIDAGEHIEEDAIVIAKAKLEDTMKKIGLNEMVDWEHAVIQLPLKAVNKLTDLGESCSDEKLEADEEERESIKADTMQPTASVISDNTPTQSYDKNVFGGEDSDVIERGSVSFENGNHESESRPRQIVTVTRRGSRIAPERNTLATAENHAAREFSTASGGFTKQRHTVHIDSSRPNTEYNVDTHSHRNFISEPRGKRPFISNLESSANDYARPAAKAHVQHHSPDIAADQFAGMCPIRRHTDQPTRQNDRQSELTQRPHTMPAATAQRMSRIAHSSQVQHNGTVSRAFKASSHNHQHASRPRSEIVSPQNRSSHFRADSSMKNTGQRATCHGRINREPTDCCGDHEHDDSLPEPICSTRAKTPRGSLTGDVYDLQRRRTTAGLSQANSSEAHHCESEAKDSFMTDVSSGSFDKCRRPFGTQFEQFVNGIDEIPNKSTQSVLRQSQPSPCALNRLSRLQVVDHGSLIGDLRRLENERRETAAHQGLREKYEARVHTMTPTANEQVLKQPVMNIMPLGHLYSRLLTTNKRLQPTIKPELVTCVQPDGSTYYLKCEPKFARRVNHALYYHNYVIAPEHTHE